MDAPTKLQLMLLEATQLIKPLKRLIKETTLRQTTIQIPSISAAIIQVAAFAKLYVHPYPSLAAILLINHREQAISTRNTQWNLELTPDYMEQRAQELQSQTIQQNVQIIQEVTTLI